MSKLISIGSRLLFIGAFVLAGLAILEKLANMMDQTFLKGFLPSRLLELAVVALVFVIALQLREMKKGTSQ